MTTNSPDAQPPSVDVGAGPAKTTDSPSTAANTASEADLAGLAELNGRTFTLVGLFTDAGGIDTMSADARFVITFRGASAVAQTQCGAISYPTLTLAQSGIGDLSIDFGEPQGPSCRLGTDPAGPPAGVLGFGHNDQTNLYWLSTGFVAWNLSEVIATEPANP